MLLYNASHTVSNQASRSTGDSTVNPLTKRARHNARRETVENYLIAGFAGVILGAMLALAI